MTTDIVLLWLPSLLITLLALGVFIALSFRNRQRIDELKQLAHDYALQRTDNFLQREIEAMRHRIERTNANDPNHTINKLRLLWLQAELAALTDYGKRRSDYDVLLNKARPISRLINRAVVPGTAVTIDQQIKRARDMLASQREAISHYRQKTAMLSAEESDSAHTQFHATLGNVEQNSSALVATIARLEQELARLQQKLDATEQRAAGTSDTPADFLIISTPNQTVKTDAAQELLQQSEDAYRQSMVEMVRMRDINSRQRQLILQLDRELLLLRKDTEQHTASSQVLDKLKLQLRDHETCTTILEDETDTLRIKIDALKKLIALKADAVKGSDREADTELRFAAPAMSPRIAARDGQTLALIEEIIGTHDPQLIAGKTAEWLQRQGLSATIYIRGADEQVWTSSEGGVDQHSKQLLQSVVPVPNKPRLDVDEGMLFIYPLLRVLVYQNATLSHDASALLSAVQHVTKIIDDWLDAVQIMQTARDRSDDAKLREHLSGVLAQYRYVTQEQSRVGERFRIELKEFFTSADISAVQREVLATMQEDFATQLDIVVKASNLVYTKLRTLADSLENK